MTALMTKVMEHLARVPEDQQAQLAQRILDMLDLSEAEADALPRLSDLIGTGKGLYNSPKEVDTFLRNLRDEA